MASRANIRAAQAGDVASITEIYADAVRNGTGTFEIEAPDQAELARRLEYLVGGGFPYLVAEHDGAVCGFAHAGPFRTRAAFDATVEDSIYVARGVRGNGLGRLLLEALVRDAAARGFREMLALIGDSANAASIGLHAALGFRRVGLMEAVGLKHGRWLDVVIMQRSLL